MNGIACWLMLAINVNAKDKSCGGRDDGLVYSIHHHSHPEFRINPQTGEICVAKALDFERQQRFQLTVFASSQDQKSATALVNINVQDLNDNAPIFSLCITSLPSVVHATDKDNGEFEGLLYSLVDSYDKTFKVDAHSGLLYYIKKAPTSMIEKKHIELTVTVSDVGKLQSNDSAVIHVNLGNTNDCPAFSNKIYKFKVSEDVLPGIVIGELSAKGATLINIQKVNEEDPEYFYLDGGKLSVSRDISESDIYFLTAQAISTSGCTSFAQVQVEVDDVNNHVPQFNTDVLKISIPENFPIHTNFFSVQAQDKDRNENGRITYELMSSRPHCPVIIQPITGQTILAAPLDYENVQEYQLVIRAQDQGIPALSSTVNVTLKVLDVNDNAPEFKQSLYKAEVPENAQLMTTVLKVLASDKDSGNNGKVKYRLVKTSYSEFEINAVTGEIYLNQELDRERQSDYSFVVVASDSGSPELETNASVHIKVLDINDNSPNCSTIQPFYIKRGEDRHIIGVIDAKDADNGANGTVTYRIQRHNEYFDVKTSGHISIKKKLPLNLESYGFFVIAEDGGPTARSVVCQVRVNIEKRTKTITVLGPVDSLIKLDPACGVGCQLARINVTNVERWELEESTVSQYFDVNDGILKLVKKIEDESLFLTPRQLVINMFEKENKQKQLTFTVKKWLRVMNNEHTNTIKVSEQLVPGTKVVSGGGALEHCYYNLDQNWSQTFGLNPSTGDVYLTSYFNYSDVNSYTIRLTRHNILIPDLVESTLIVEVENENLHSPKFSSVYYNFSVIEDVPIGTRVGQLSAFDEDDGNNKTLTFKMVGDNSYFTVDESNGEIYTKTALDYGKQEKHQLVVEVLDNPPDFRNKRSSKCVVVVDVIDTNNHVPLFLSDSNITIVLDPLVNSIPVHYFVAEDSDSGDFGRVRYSIIDGNKPEYFSLDSVTGELSMIHRPDGVIKLTVRAADQDLVTPQHTDQLFTVNVKQNEVQWFFFSKSVNEITVTDAEKGATLIDFGKKIKTNSLYFKLLPQTEKSFLIDQSTGVVKLNSDNLQQPKYHLTAYVLDKISNKSDTTSVVVTVPEVQYGPKMSDVSCGEISVIENRNFDSLTRVVATINGKPSKEIHYSIVGGSGGDRFEINQASGVISSKPLDRESQDEYILVVSASDKHTPQRVDVCTIKVHVLDENDNAPEFKDNATVIFTITEKDAPGAIIGRVEATDNDIGPGGKVWYKLSNDESGMLDIIPSTGDIIFARNLPFTSFGWEATVIAEDLGLSKTLHSSKTITIKWERKSIKVTDIDEVQFLRHNYTATVIEGLPKGTFVIQVESTDIFMPINKVTYKIISGNNDAAFTVDELGVLKTAQVLDSEINSVYILKLVAIGNFRTLPECLVTVRVINVNDNSPIFSPPLIQHIEEDLPSGSLVMSVRARDADPESILEYALSPPTEFFHLNRFTGELLLLKPLDFETQAVHVLNVHAYDGEHTVFTEFTVRVLDVNDNAPKFSTDLFEFSAGATVLQGATIGRISAMDADSEEFGRLHYSLIEAQNFVALDGDTGLVTLMKPLRSDQNVFLTVQARDFGTPPLMSLSTIRLSGATRTNKKAPRFKKTEFKFMVAEDFPLYLSFGQVDVTTGVNALLEYSIISFDGSSPPFKILPNGKLYLVGPLDYTAKQTYNFEISVKNAFEPENSRNTVVSKANLFITVTDANNNGPVVDASSRNINVTLKENFEKGQFIAKIQAADADAGNNGKLSYFILASSVPSMLKLDENTGDVTFDQWYDNSFTELRSRRDITEEIIVLISDNGAKKRWTNTKMTVTLLFNDWSGSAPFFPVPYYKAFLPEATHEGATVVNVRPVNRLGLYDNSWRYDIIHNDEIFTINSTDGTVYLSGKLDFELHNEYEFIVTVSDSMGRSDRISVYVSVLGIDENAPMFTMPSYEFYVPWSASVGQEIGIVEATDADKGVHSKVVYTLQDKHLKSIGIDGASGTLMLLEPLSRYSNHSVEEITVIASSSPVQFSKVPVTLHFMDSTDVIYTIQNNVPHLNRLIIGIGTSLFVLFCVLLVFMLYKIMQRRGQLQRPKRHIYSVAKGNVATMANVNKMSPNYFKTVKSISSTAHTTISQPCSIKSYEHEEINVKPESDYVRSCDEAMLRSQIDSGIDPDSSSIVSGVTDYLNHVTARTSITFSSTNPIVNQILNANIQDDVSANEAPISSIQPTVGLARPLSIRKQLHFNFPELPSINRIISENEKDDNILL
ncbi:unnamed protein product [Bursaphelenchus okinawaensis]|uniref:Cadherin domain-containing protein n=1 Tax=Bursaphelenchus okinawaensis TaxID=465554 RepID=A0A811KJ56_9BILA|nr:unnamed protein product [Bursaphelenchus okinawaensis]CAG9104795.1 unnamed protein product [Bursaphelenchus okinawaensis]